MITAYLIGDQELLGQLQALPKAVHAGLARNLTQLGLGVQRTLRGSTRDIRQSTSQADFRIDASGTSVAASIRRFSQRSRQIDRLAGTTNVRGSLERQRETFARSMTTSATGLPAGGGVACFAEPSFLRSALDGMTPTVRDSINAALAEAVSR